MSQKAITATNKETIVAPYRAIDLHSNNNVPAVIDQNDKVLFSKRLPNHLPTVVRSLEPYKSDLQSFAVESLSIGTG